MSMFQPQEGQAAWDQRIAFHQRLHAAILTANRDMYNNDYAGWYRALLSLKISLSPHMNSEEKVAINKLMEKCFLFSSGKGVSPKPFVEAQEFLHQVMRNKSFDVPIVERSEEGLLASMNQ